MDQAAALLVALRAAAGLGDGRLGPARVEALAGALGIEGEALPALATRWQRAGQVAIAWGGVLEVLPEAPAGASVVIDGRGASFGPGATIAGRDATGGTVTITPEAAFGALAAVLVKLREIRPGLAGEAAEAADRAAETLKTPPPPEAPAETRHAWATAAGEWFGRLLKAAPQARRDLQRRHRPWTQPAGDATLSGAASPLWRTRAA